MITNINTKVYDICDNNPHYDFSLFEENPVVFDNCNFQKLPIGQVKQMWLTNKIQMEIEFSSPPRSFSKINIITIDSKLAGKLVVAVVLSSCSCDEKVDHCDCDMSDVVDNDGKLR